MADYGNPININDFLYRKEIFFTNTTNDFHESMLVKLTLNASNFNFDLIRSGCEDFRLLYNNSTLRMWVAYWSYTEKLGVLYFKLQDIEPNAVITLKACWGNNDIELESDPSNMGFYFYEDFEYTPLSNLKWIGQSDYAVSQVITKYGYSLTADYYYFTTNTNPLSNITDWVIEIGAYPKWTNNADITTYYAFGLKVIGTENDFAVNFLPVNSISTSVGNSSSVVSVTQTAGGLENNCYNEVKVSYKECLDSVKVFLTKRSSYLDSVSTIKRIVEGDTRPVNLRIYGWQTGSYVSSPYPTYLDWLIIRKYEDYELELDSSNLYIDYKPTNHELQSYLEYGQDITTTVFNHESSFGGNPYLLSEGQFNSEDSVWITNELAASEDYIHVTIYTGWVSDITSRSYIHYDSSHVNYYNASKLSDNDEDSMTRNYFNSTTSSGWAAIKFPSPQVVTSLRFKATTDLKAAPKDFKFYGSNYNPYLYFSRAEEIFDGAFLKTSNWQAKMFTNNTAYKYYILDVLNTYENDNIKIQEWEMFRPTATHRKKYIQQLRLVPAIYNEDYQAGFPKQICLQGSNDNINWTTLLPWTDTFTPFIQHIPSYGYEQRYSFSNEKGFWTFKLLCKGNWGRSDGKIIIGEWGMHELASENFTYRILAGQTNNIKQIWTTPECTYNDPTNFIYVTNEYLNIINNNKLLSSTVLPEGCGDLIVV